MKMIFLSVLFAAFAVVLAAQAPQAINYQAVARNTAGTPITNTTIGVQFRILQGSSSGTLTYAETYTTNTNSLGLFNLAIGRGTVQFGVFANILWVNSPYFLEVSIDPTGGTNYTVVGTSEMLSVPYALYAERGPKASVICDSDEDTFVQTIPSGNIDEDEIHMHLGETPGIIQPGLTTKSLVLRKTTPNPFGRNTMLELFDPTGGLNTFVGQKAGENNTYQPIGFNGNLFDVGIDNTALGYDALGDNTIGRDNTAIGAQSLRLNTTGHFNTGMGFLSLTNNQIGNNNTATGYRALHYNTEGFANTAIGSEALYNNQANGRSTAIGYHAMLNADNRGAPGIFTYNTAVGFEALYGGPNVSANTGTSNTAIGDQSLYSNTTGSSNVAIGKDALFSNTDRSNLVAVGDLALYNNGTGATAGSSEAQFNTALGSKALYTNTIGANNTAVGYNALYDNVSGGNNTAVGLEALRFNLTSTANTATGVWAMRLNKTGSYNTSNGAFALGINIGGDANTATGVDALGGNINGTSNTATGVGALQNNIANNNTAIGYYALLNNVGGNLNTAIGYAADVNAPNLTNASAIGANAKVLTSNTMILGDNQVNVGIGPLINNGPLGPQNKLEIDAAPATDASGLSFRQLPYGATASAALPLSLTTPPKVLSVDAMGKVILVEITGAGGGGNEWRYLGDNIAGIIPLPLLGTTSPDPLTFIVNNDFSGIIHKDGATFFGYEAGLGNSTNLTNTTNTGFGFNALKNNGAGTNNTATGYQSLLNNTGSANTAIGTFTLRDNTTGDYNTAVGVDALHDNVAGFENTAVGGSALRMNKSNDNTAMGVRALEMNVNGVGNTAMSVHALRFNDDGNYNTATGIFALEKNIDGNENTATGAFALKNNTTIGQNSGYFNTATGAYALQNNTIGTDNTATGVYALENNNGNENTASGNYALRLNTIGTQNTAVGLNALWRNVDGHCNTAIGYDAGPGIGFGSLVNTTAIGCNAKVNASNTMKLGNSITNNIATQGGYTVISDGRFKSAVQSDAPGLDFILRLQPVTYKFEYSKFSEFLGEKDMDSGALRQKEQNREMGFIAQEVENTLKETNTDIVNLVYKPQNEQDNYSIAYSQFVVPLVKAVQEQQTQIEALKLQNAQLSTLAQQSQSLQTQLDALRAEMQYFRAALEKQLIPNDNNR